jgi:hypothetical protein
MNAHAQQTLEQLDSLLDSVDLKINELPIPNAVKRELASRIYDLWTEIEDAVEVRATDWE